MKAENIRITVGCTMHFETPRLVVRSFAPSDVAAYSALVADPKVMKYLGVGLPLDEAQAKGYVERCIENERTLGFARYALDLRSADEFIGFCGFALIDGYIDLGYRIASRHWGNTYAREAVQTVIEYGFERLGFESIVATVYIENKRSIRVIEKLGFEFERSDTTNEYECLRYCLRKQTSA